MRRYKLHAIALTLIWVGATEIAGSFFAKLWFQFHIEFTPFFFLALIAGIGLYVFARVF